MEDETVKLYVLTTKGERLLDFLAQIEQELGQLFGEEPFHKGIGMDRILVRSRIER